MGTRSKTGGGKVRRTRPKKGRFYAREGNTGRPMEVNAAMKNAINDFHASANMILDLLESAEGLTANSALSGASVFGSFSDAVQKRWPAIDKRIKELVPSKRIVLATSAGIVRPN